MSGERRVLLTTACRLESSEPAGAELASLVVGRRATPATAPALASSKTLELGTAIGRFRVLSKLGAGGMGVVFAAYDPKLDRKVAIKLLQPRSSNASRIEGRQIEAEAQAMARLAHPNVVTVFETGHFGDRPFVAMELVEGVTLRRWHHDRNRSWREIVKMFVGAGRGLAAAHAAGLVHRDFKPDNVLVGNDGRARVADFGLVRRFADDDAVSPERTRSRVDLRTLGRASGTPGYMAPEQWAGHPLDAQADQFAFCVALWEALAGERPYRGPTLDELRAQTVLGPAALDASRIPRRLRAILRRGLDPDPGKRWPSIDALLNQLTRAERRPGIGLALVVGALVAIAVVVLAMRGGNERLARQRCDPPVLDPQQVWSTAAHARIGRQTAAGKLLDADLAAWRIAREAACKADQVTRAPRLSCLDGVLARIDAVAGAVRIDRDRALVDAGALLIDPAVCDLARPPRLMTNTSPELRDVMAAWLARAATAVPPEPAAIQQLVARAGGEPCAAALAHLLAADVTKALGERSRHLDEAQQEAERCGDDRVLADTALSSAQRMMDNEWLSEAVTAKLRLADAAVHRVAQRDLTAQIDMLRFEVARRAENLVEAIARGGAAVDGFAGRGRLRPEITAGLNLLELRAIRATPSDLAAIPAQLAAWRARAVAELGAGDESVRALDLRTAQWAFSHGDVAGAHATLDRLARPLPNDRPQRLTGIVVDGRGAPVAGATVTTGRSLHGNAVSAAGGFDDRDSIRAVHTGCDGRFAITDAADDAVVVAQLGNRRSAPAAIGEDVRLVLAPTSWLEGRIDLSGEVPSHITIVMRDASWPVTVMPRYSIHAPVAADGSFTAEGVPRGQIRMYATITGLGDKAVSGSIVEVRGPMVRGVALSAKTSGRVVRVLVRNTVNSRLANAQVLVLPGRVPSANALEMNRRFRGGSLRMARQLDSEHAPEDVVAAARPGDLFATVSDAPDGVASACALGLPEFSDDALERKLYAHLDRIQVICAVVPDHADLLTIEVPPFPRLD